MALAPTDFESMFRSGMRYGWPDGASVEVEVMDVGAVNLASGLLVFRDNSRTHRACARHSIELPTVLQGVTLLSSLPSLTCT
jgi:hypothetical protein